MLATYTCFTVNHSQSAPPNKNFTYHSPGGMGLLTTYTYKLSPKIFQFSSWRGASAPTEPAGYAYV